MRRQLLQQQGAVCGVACLHRFQFLARVERGEGGDLGKVGRRDVEVLRQPLDRAHETLRHDHPADAPAGHAVVFRERVDHDRVVVGRQRRRRRRGVGEAMIDLVGDEPQAEPPAGLAERGAARAPRSSCRTGSPGSWRGRRARGFVGMRLFDRLRRHDPAVGFGQRDDDRFKTERFQDVAIGRIARCRDRDALCRGRTGSGRRGRSRPRSPSSPRSARARPLRRRRPDSVGRCARAAARSRAPPYSRCGPPRAPPWRPPGRRAGAGAEGWPTSIWTTLSPRLSFAAAALNTSMARNGATRSMRRATSGGLTGGRWILSWRPARSRSARRRSSGPTKP